MANANGSDSSGQYFLKYCPHLRDLLGTKQAVMTADRLEYWFNANGGSFYKFLEPCQRTAGYRPGDSLAEELGVSGKSVQRSFDLIGTRYKSKKDFDEALASGDVFKGKIYASYNNRQTYKTHYFRNDELADKVFGRSFSKSVAIANSREAAPSKPQSSRENNNHITLHVSGNGHFVRHRNGQNVRHRNGQNVRHLSRAQALKQINTNKENLPLDDQHRSKPPTALSTDDEFKVGRMIKIFNEIVGGVSVEKASQSIKVEALESLKINFNESLEEWEKHCIAISCSCFLMGETKSDHFKKIVFKWAFSRDFIERIRSGHYQRDREGALKKKIDGLVSVQATQSAAKRHEESELALNRFKRMSVEQTEEIKRSFEAYLLRPDSVGHGFAREMLRCRGEEVWELVFEQNWQSSDKTLFLSSLKEFLVQYFGAELKKTTTGSAPPEDQGLELSEIEKYRMDYARISGFDQEAFFSEQDTQTDAFIQKESVVTPFEEEGRGGPIIIEDITKQSCVDVHIDLSIRAEEEAFATMRDKARIILKEADDDDLVNLRNQYEEYAIRHDPIALDIMEKGGWNNPVLNLLFEQYLISHHCNEHEGGRTIH